MKVQKLMKKFSFKKRRRETICTVECSIGFKSRIMQRWQTKTMSLFWFKRQYSQKREIKQSYGNNETRLTQTLKYLYKYIYKSTSTYINIFKFFYTSLHYQLCNLLCSRAIVTYCCWLLFWCLLCPIIGFLNVRKLLNAILPNLYKDIRLKAL